MPDIRLAIGDLLRARANAARSGYTLARTQRHNTQEARAAYLAALEQLALFATEGVIPPGIVGPDIIGETSPSTATAAR